MSRLRKRTVRFTKQWINESGLSRQTLWTHRCRRGPDGKTAYVLRKGRKFARALPHFVEKTSSYSLESRKVWRESNHDGRTESSLGVSDRSDELYVGTERGMHKVLNSQKWRGHTTS